MTLTPLASQICRSESRSGGPERDLLEATLVVGCMAGANPEKVAVKVGVGVFAAKWNARNKQIPPRLGQISAFCAVPIRRPPWKGSSTGMLFVTDVSRSMRHPWCSLDMIGKRILKARVGVVLELET